MKFPKSMALSAAAVTAASLGAAALVGGTAAGASELGGVPTITVHVGGGKIGFVGGDTTLHAGRIKFKVITGRGTHILQALRLHKGYSLQEAGQDFGKAFGGDIAAIRRVDDNITFRGGAVTRPNKPGYFVVTLPAGHFYMIDQNSNAVKAFTVWGKVQPRRVIPNNGTIKAYSYGFGAMPDTMPAKGMLRFYNQADQPHFLEMQHVAANTTRAMVMHGLRSSGRPSWIRPGSNGAGVISPRTGQLLAYDLPPGKYLIACFWPAIDTGMPHAFMGMFDFITLK